MLRLGLSSQLSGFARAGFILALAMGLMAGCGREEGDLLKDGYYTAEAAEYNSEGWKEFLTIYVSAGRIVSAEYNSKNLSGFLRSWDMADKRLSNITTGTNQSKYARAYTTALLNRQDPAKITPIPGAVKAHPNFQLLAAAAVAQSKAGSHRPAFVELKDHR